MRATSERETYHALSCIHAARRALGDAESYINGNAACPNPYERARVALALAEANIATATEEARSFVDIAGTVEQTNA
jgi:hypothetical protein